MFNDQEEGHHYRAYGLNLYSVIPLPELRPGGCPADVVIRPGLIAERPDSHSEQGTGFWIGAEMACHFRQEAGAYLAKGGNEIIVDSNPAAAPELVRLSILGPALGLILHQRGIFTLHGSAVEIDGSAVVFLGPNRSGKSTMAALLHARGHALLSDDVTSLETNSTRVRVIPSFPQIKLWPDAANVVGSAEDMSVLHPAYEKRALRAADGFKDEPVALSRLYLLSVRDEIEITPINGTRGFELLLASWYGARFGDSFVRGIDQRAHFKACISLMRKIPMRVLGRPATLRKDPRLSSAIEAAILRDLNGPGR